jgi:hypothetical protein
LNHVCSAGSHAVLLLLLPGVLQARQADARSHLDEVWVDCGADYVCSAGSHAIFLLLLLLLLL